MRIISLQAENFKKLQAVEITPEGNFVQITGKNGQGKSSTLDAIWVALAGLDASPKRPIRKGAESAKIRLDLGEIRVTRHFKETETGSFTSSLTVESAEGARYPSPQKMLDGLIGALSFDPVAFIGMDAKAQFNYCRRFVPEIDFDALANADRGDRQRREEIGRLGKQERAAETAIMVPEGTPDEEIDESALMQELKNAGDSNAARERAVAARASRDSQRQELQKIRDRATQKAADFEKERGARCERECSDLMEEIGRLQARIELAKTNSTSEITRYRESCAREHTEATDAIAALDATVDAPLPDVIDTTPILARITAARATNANVRKAIERNKHKLAADQLGHQYKQLSAAITKREADKQAAIAAAKMPIEGLSFGDGVVLFGGVPLEQASDAEKLRVSVALSMAANPKLKVVFIRNGSLLDDDGLRLVAEMADKNDVQVWVERVSSDGKVGIVLEDGKIKGNEP